MSSTRRTFVVQLVGAGSLLAASRSFAQVTAKLEEADPQAAALGYKLDTTKVDEKKYPQHAAAQKCASCQLFQGKAGDAMGACPIFAGKQVAASGWCSAFVKKTG